MQDKYASKGLALIAMHAQSEPAGGLKAWCAQRGINYTVTTFGRLQGDNSRGIPKMFVFDPSGKCVYSGRSSSEADKVIEAQIAKAPHFLTRGRSFEVKSVASQARKLFSSKYGRIAKSLEDLKDKAQAEIEKANASEAEQGSVSEATQKQLNESTFLLDNIRAYGQQQLSQAKADELRDPTAAYELYKTLYGQFSGIEIGDKAKARYNELKKDKAFQNELKAARALVPIEKLAGEIKPTVRGRPEPKSNVEVRAKMKVMINALIKRYPGTVAAKSAQSLAAAQGVKLN